MQTFTRDSKATFKRLLISHTVASEKELSKRLLIQIIAIFSLIFGGLISITVFGPQIGGLLAAISIHRNDKDPGAQLGISAPVFSNVPLSTKNDTITLNGITEPGATVTLFVNGPLSGTVTADSSGLFTFTDVALNAGTNTIFSKATSTSGTESKASDSISITKDTLKPEIEITSPKDGDVIKNLDKRILVKGKVNEKAEIKINDRFAILNSDLTFSVFVGVEEGKVQIKVTATDTAGNTADKTINVEYQKKSL